MAVIASLKGLGGEAAQSIALFREAARAAGGMPDADDEKVFAAIARGDVRSVDLARA